MPLHLLVKWWRWFLQIVDIHVGNFNMKLTGRWFPQIVNRDSGNLYPIYIYIAKIVVLVSEPVRGRSRATELPCFYLIFLMYLVSSGFSFKPTSSSSIILIGPVYPRVCGECAERWSKETFNKLKSYLCTTRVKCGFQLNLDKHGY